MIVRVADLQPDGLPVDLRLQLGPLEYEGSLDIGVTGARLQAVLRPSRQGIHCEGRLEATVFVPCSRCLEAYSLRIDKRFSVDYLPARLAGTGGAQDMRIPSDELDVGYLDSEGRLVLEDLAAEQIYLELPMKPICREDCEGLCAGCGANLNTEECRCVPSAG